jgi:hypothetical protein
VTSKVDPSRIHKALTELLKSLPDNNSLEPSPELNHLRADLSTAIKRMTELSISLDPIKRPDYVFDPTNPKIVGKLIGRTLLEQDAHDLNRTPRVYGSGVYAIYFKGDFEPYMPIRGTRTPIYVGKADPKEPDAKTVEDQGDKLFLRLSEHAKSIRAAKTSLRIEDFKCRFLVVQSGWQKSAEDYLIRHFNPLWNNKICIGFGKHGDSHETRKNTRSPWDTLHPGRPWATKEGNIAGDLSLNDIKRNIREHFVKNPPET